MIIWKKYASTESLFKKKMYTNKSCISVRNFNIFIYLTRFMHIFILWHSYPKINRLVDTDAIVALWKALGLIEDLEEVLKLGRNLTQFW